MSLKDDILAESRSGNTVEAILADLDEDDRSDLVELLAMVEVEATAIARGLRRRGYQVSDRTIQRYRRTLEEMNRG